MTTPVALPAWKALEEHYAEVRDLHMRDLFAQDPERFPRFTARLNDILFDYSKNRITDRTLTLLLDLARQADVEGWRERMFAGEPINHTEQRPVLHVALRNMSGSPCLVDGEDIMPEIRRERDRVYDLARRIRCREWRGATNQPITDIVNIGIGGSHLGPEMVTQALRPYAVHDLRLHFLNNLDENHILNTLEALNPETTLFIVASKSFTTQDTMVNAES
ncbi:MAG: glucose-6-phosphate isomerase, partial [Gammaproteobacteria bacterium]